MYFQGTPKGEKRKADATPDNRGKQKKKKWTNHQTKE